MKPDERQLLLALAASTEEFTYVRSLVSRLGIPEKRAAYICGKWTDKGWYDWGVNVLAGWLTDEGRTEAAKARSAPEIEVVD